MKTDTLESNRLDRLDSNGHTDPILDGHAPQSRDREGASSPSAEPRIRDNSIASAAGASLRFKIPGDVIARACKELTDEQRNAVNWAANYCRSRNISHHDFAQLLRKPGTDKPYSHDSVYYVFTGNRDPQSGSLDNFTQSVNVLRRRVEETEARSSIGFVETATYKSIAATCRKAFLKKRIACVLGETQTGKSRCANEYAKRFNHGETKYFRIPAGGNFRDFLMEMAEVLGIARQEKSYALKRRIIDCFDGRTLAIFDELEQCLEARGGMLIIEFIREIWDRRKCGVVGIGALNFRAAAAANYTLKKFVARGIRPVILPSRPTDADLNEFATAFGLPSAPDKNIGINLPEDEYPELPRQIQGNPLAIQTDVIKDFGLGRWLTTLEEARDLAPESTKLKWTHVILAHALFNQDPS